MKAVIYTRVSTEEQSREGVSLANQLAKCRLQCQLDDMDVLAEIEDAGKSAKSLNRDGIQKILQMVKRKECDAVVIYKLDRLTRSVTDLNELVDTLNKHGVSLVSVQDHLDTQSASGRMVMNLLATISQWERETIAERTSTALQYKKSENKRYCGVTPYGFVDVNGVPVLAPSARPAPPCLDGGKPPDAATATMAQPARQGTHEGRCGAAIREKILLESIQAVFLRWQ